MKDVTGRFLIHEDEQLKCWKEHFTTVFNRLTSGEVAPLVDAMAGHCNKRKHTASLNRREIISVNNAFKRNKTARLTAYPPSYLWLHVQFLQPITTSTRTKILKVQEVFQKVKEDYSSLRFLV